MKIALICNELPPAPLGGVGSFTVDLARVLVGLGHGVTVIGVYAVAQTVAEERDGVRVIRLARRRGATRLSFFRDRLGLARSLRVLASRGAIEIVEAPETGGWSIAIPTALPVVVRLHSPARYMARVFTRRRRGRLLDFVEDMSIRRAHGLVAVSRWVANRAWRDYPLAGLEQRNIEVIYNGVDTDLFAKRPWDGRVPNRIVFAGTLKPQKGIVTLFGAFSRVLGVVPGAELVLAGRDTAEKGGSYFEFAQRAAGLDAATRSRIRWLGAVPREKLPLLYGSATVCAFPSLGESFGLVAAEAMAVGRPVVYSRDTAGPELIEHGVSGLLADPTDPAEVARAMLRLLGDEEYARSIARQGADAVRKRFSVLRCGEETQRFYKRVLASRGDA